MGNMLETVLSVLGRLQMEKNPLLLALDGRCAAGKTTLAGQLRERTGCMVIHMDDFFLRPEQRTAERLAQPGGNVDWQRFLEEVLLPLKKGRPFQYRPYDCHTQALREPVRITPGSVTLVEGSYSCHPRLWTFYDFHIFLDITKEEQLSRIEKRNGSEMLEVFRSRWIPMEESYFQTFSIEERCELRFPERKANLEENSHR